MCSYASFNVSKARSFCEVEVYTNAFSRPNSAGNGTPIPTASICSNFCNPFAYLPLAAASLAITHNKLIFILPQIRRWKAIDLVTKAQKA